MNIERRSFDFVEVKATGDGKGQIEGYGAVFGNVDSYGDVIQKGAFNNTLREWKAKSKLPKMLLQHGALGITNTDMLPIGKWTSMSEDDHGLKVKGQLFSLDTEFGSRVYDAIIGGELDSMSIGYQTVKWVNGDGKKTPERTLLELKLWEVSLVTFPANDQALMTTVKSRVLRGMEKLLRDEGLSNSLAKKALSELVDRRALEEFVRKENLRDEGQITHEELRDEVSLEEKELLEALSKLTDKTWEGVFR